MYLQAILAVSLNWTRHAALRYRFPTHPLHGPQASQSTPICRTFGYLSETDVRYSDSYRDQSAIESADTVWASADNRSNANSTRSLVSKPVQEYRTASARVEFCMTNEWSDVMYTRFDSNGSAMPRTTSFLPFAVTALVLPLEFHLLSISYYERFNVLFGVLRRRIIYCCQIITVYFVISGSSVEISGCVPGFKYLLIITFVFPGDKTTI